MDDRSTPKWQKAAAWTVGIVTIIAIVVFRNRLGADFWPLDSSRVAPNLLAGLIQWAIIFVLAILLYPPFRKAIHSFFDGKLEGLHAKIDGLDRRHDEHARKLAKIEDEHARVREQIADHFDENTPGGIQVILARIDDIEKELTAHCRKPRSR